MPHPQNVFNFVAILGAGAMGKGIAQLIVQAGVRVVLFDTNPQALENAKTSIDQQWERMLEKNRITPEDLKACAGRLRLSGQMEDLRECDLVIEAIVENLAVKAQVFKSLESILQPECLLTSNTSSLSITAISSALNNPKRLMGLHFFNPVMLMKVVEVIRGLHSRAEDCARLTEFVKRLGHTPVLAQDTPGFIVNHASRGYSTESLRIAQESIADFAQIDLILRDQAGFKLGPFELLDLTALDVSHPVMEAIYHQYYEEPRYRPSYITAQRLAGGLLGKKVGQGFYTYTDGVKQPVTEIQGPLLAREELPSVWVSSKAARRAELYALFKDLELQIETTAAPSAQALCWVAPLGLDVTTACVLEGLDPSRTVGIDMLFAPSQTRRWVMATNPALRADMKQAGESILRLDSKAVSVIKDSAGFVTQRVLACLINICCDMCQQGICSPTDLDLAATLGLGYPSGPLSMGDAVGGQNILEILFNMQTVYADPRYRASPWLRRRAAMGLSLLHMEA
jgi:3-hydroxybutyryl-CoA dehydrogenase